MTQVQELLNAGEHSMLDMRVARDRGGFWLNMSEAERLEALSSAYIVDAAAGLIEICDLPPEAAPARSALMILYASMLEQLGTCLVADALHGSLDGEDTDGQPAWETCADVHETLKALLSAIVSATCLSQGDRQLQKMAALIQAVVAGRFHSDWPLVQHVICSTHRALCLRDDAGAGSPATALVGLSLSMLAALVDRPARSSAGLPWTRITAT